jgi:hypothetical protein
MPVEIIEADTDGFPRLPKVLCLIDCDRPEHELQKRYALFWNYLQITPARDPGLDLVPRARALISFGVSGSTIPMQE